MNRYLEQGNAGEKARTGDQFPALGALAGAWAALLRDRFGVANRQEGTRGHPAELSPIFRIPPTASPGSVYRNTSSQSKSATFPTLCLRCRRAVPVSKLVMLMALPPMPLNPRYRRVPILAPIEVLRITMFHFPVRVAPAATAMKKAPTRGAVEREVRKGRALRRLRYLSVKPHTQRTFG
jgi:hypothetical protein